MTELECEIKRLEDKLEGRLKKLKPFKNTVLTNKTAFELEVIRAEIRGNEESNKSYSFKISFVAAITTFILTTIVSNKTNINNILEIIFFVVFPMVAWLYIINIFARKTKMNTEVLNLLDMLIERKKKLELESRNQ